MHNIDTISELLFDEEKCVQYLVEEGVIASVIQCDSCGREVLCNNKRKTYRCQNRNCRREVTMLKGTFFAQSKLPCRKIMQIAYFWLNKVPATSIVAMTGCSSATVTSFAGHLRELVADSLTEEDCVVGGPGVVVEIDETKLGKRKYERGHRVEGVWVLGGVERTEVGRVFVATIADRSAATLIGVIHRHVLPGSIVFSDMWRGYSGLSEILGVEHHVVNHSVEFVTHDGVHTNTIEATWCGLKLLIPKRNRTKNIEKHLWEYVWRKRHRADTWDAFIRALKDICYD